MSRRPKLRSIGIAATVSVALLLSLGPSPAVAGRFGAPIDARTLRLAVGSDSWKLFRATNASRGRFDVPKLRLNRELSMIARRHSLAMARNRELFHTTDVDVYLHGIAWHVWGENVGYTPGDVTSIQQAFMESLPHRENILNRAFGQVAIGAVRVDGTLWVTVFFYA
ncbi:MAG: CAP domain-containing protein [Actinomycetota bacterium]